MKQLKSKFTKWYTKRGYTFWLDFNYKGPIAMFRCPIWVRPLLIFFSPSVYVQENFFDGVWGKNI